MTRRPDWEQRLIDFIADSRTRMFKWGSFDCGTWAAAAIDAMCDSDIVARLATDYTTGPGAVDFVRGRGWPTLAHAAEWAVGRKRMLSPSYAQRGDLVWVPDTKDNPIGTLCILIGTDIIGPTGEGVMGVSTVPWRALIIAGAEAYRV